MKGADMKQMMGAAVWVGAMGFVAAVCALNAAEPMATAEVTVDVGTVLGPVKPMHAVNNGPAVSKPGGDQKRGNFETYRAARIPFARTHDANFSASYGSPHTVDVDAIFPDFDADETDGANYRFAYTDSLLNALVANGVEPYFRLGVTIENFAGTGIRHYGSPLRRTSRSGRASANM
jgi:hypothetical protein